MRVLFSSLTKQKAVEKHNESLGMMQNTTITYSSETDTYSIVVNKDDRRVTITNRGLKCRLE